jgi:hypothetical protein
MRLAFESLRLVGVVALAALGGCGGAAGDDAAASQDIVGGTEDNGDPAVVAINIESTGFTVCTGTLIADDVVLTAGHCPETGIWVRRGANVHSLGWFDHLGVKATAKHPQYTAEGKPYDLALLRLDDRVSDITPARLSDVALGSADIGANIRHVGYGTTGDDWHYVEEIGTGGIKREVAYPITKVDDFFVYSGAPGKQTCVFDSGGPAFRKNATDGTESLIAVVSAGDDCHSDGWDTRIDRPDVRAWIDATLASWD